MLLEDLGSYERLLGGRFRSVIAVVVQIAPQISITSGKVLTYRVYLGAKNRLQSFNNNTKYPLTMHSSFEDRHLIYIYIVMDHADITFVVFGACKWSSCYSLHILVELLTLN